MKYQPYRPAYMHHPEFRGWQIIVRANCGGEEYGRTAYISDLQVEQGYVDYRPLLAERIARILRREVIHGVITGEWPEGWYHGPKEVSDEA